MKLQPAFRVAVLTSFAAVVGLSLAARSEAAMVLRISDGTTTVTLFDANNDGVISYDSTVSGAVGNFVVQFTAGVSKPVFPNTSTYAAMDLVNLSISSTTGGTLTIELTDTDFLASTGNGLFVGAVGGTTTGSVSFDAYKSEGNGEFETASSPELHLDFGSFGAGDFSDLIISPHGPLNTFSMTLVAVITHGSGIRSTSFDFMVENGAPDEITLIPEPATMTMWAFGLLGCAAATRFRRRRA